MADNESKREASEFEADFLIADVRHRYGFRIDWESVLEEWLYVYPNAKKQTWFHRTKGNPIAFSKKMPGGNRTIESLTRGNSLFLSAAAQNSHEALMPVYSWLTGLLLVGDRAPFLGQTAFRCANEPAYRDEIARLVSVADLGIAGVVVEEPELTGQTKAIVDAFKSTLPPEPGSLPGKLLDMKLVHRFGDSTLWFDRRLESAGTIAYLSLLGPVVDAIRNGTPLLVDELDASLHPLLARLSHFEE